MAAESRYRPYNPNPNPNHKKDKITDCVIRAFCKAIDAEWADVYTELSKMGLEMYAMPNDKVVWKKFLQNSGFIHHTIPRALGSKRPTVSSFAQAHKKGTYILQIKNHIVTCEDGLYYDTWDCGNKSLYAYWEKA